MTVPFFDTRFQAMAHRGGSHPGIGENSLRAFEAAAELGYRYLETDVHATSDGVLMAFHDESLERLTDGHGLITEHTAEELAELRIRVAALPEIREEFPGRTIADPLGVRTGVDPIPTMAGLLRALPEARFNIDIKSDSGIEPLARVLDETGAHQRVCVTSFSGARLGAFRQLAGDRVATGMSQGSVALLAFTPVCIGRLAKGLVAQVPARILGGRLPLVTRRFVRAAHRTGRRVHVWTINDAETIGELIDLGVDGIVTDNLGVLKDVLIARGLWEGNA